MQCSDKDKQQSSAGRKNVSEEERLISIAAGAVLLFGVARYGSLPGLVSAVAAASLLRRGLTGHCDLYQALDIDTSTPNARRDQRAVTAEDEVDRASRESFPASDAPAWTGAAAT